jgi:hypothetical protein
MRMRTLRKGYDGERTGEVVEARGVHGSFSRARRQPVVGIRAAEDAPGEFADTP